MAKNRNNSKWTKCGKCGERVKTRYQHKHICKDLDINDMFRDETPVIPVPPIEELTQDIPVPVAPAPVVDEKEDKDTNTCEVCGYIAVNAGILAIHTKRDHPAEAIDLDAVERKIDQAINFWQRSTQEAIEQAEIDHEKYMRYVGLENKIEGLKKALKNYISSANDMLIKPNEKRIQDAMDEIYDLEQLLALYGSDVRVVRGQFAATATERQAKKDEAQHEVDNLNKAEQAKLTAWADHHIERYNLYKTGHTWVGASGKMWEEYMGAMPWMLSLFWKINKFRKDYEIPNNVGKMREDGRTIEYIREFLGEYDFYNGKREVVTYFKWTVDEDGNPKKGKPIKESVTHTLPLEEWVEQLVELYYKYILEAFGRGDQVETKWIKENGFWGRRIRIENQHTPTGKITVAKSGQTQDDDGESPYTEEEWNKFLKVLAQVDDPEAEEESL